MADTDPPRSEGKATDDAAAPAIRVEAEVEPEAVSGSAVADADVASPKRRLSGLARMIRYHLIIPIARGRHDGVPTARGTAIGLAFGLTPTVGIQMPMILVFWSIAKWFSPRWKFNLIVALAWTWPTNVVTAPAYYYLCLITGRLMMGEGAGLGFEEFRTHIESVLSQDAGFFRSLWVYMVEIFSVWGVPLFVGCLPWAVAGTWLGYVGTLKFLAKLRERQRKQMLKRRARLARKRRAQERARQAQ